MTKPNLPLVSIIIITFNDEKYIKESLESAINQTYKNLEIIVVDDGSVDNTKDVIKDYLHKINYVFQKNGGMGSARALGFNLAKGKYVQFLDSDDILPIDKVEWQTKILENNKEISFVYGSTKCFYDKKNLDEAWYHPNYKFSKSGNLLEDIITYGNFVNIGQPLFKRKIILNAGGLDSDIEGSDDQDLMIRMAINGAYSKFVDKVSYYYRHMHDIEKNQAIARHQSLDRHKGELRAWKKFLNINLDIELEKIIYKKISNIYYEISKAYYIENNIKEAINNLNNANRYKSNFLKFILFIIIFKLISYNRLKKIRSCLKI